MRRARDSKTRALQLLRELRYGRPQRIHAHTQLRRLIGCRQKLFGLRFAIGRQPQADNPGRGRISNGQVRDKIFCAFRQLQLPAAADKITQDRVDEVFSAARVFFCKLHRLADRGVFRYRVHKCKLIQSHAQQG